MTKQPITQVPTRSVGWHPNILIAQDDPMTVGIYLAQGFITLIDVENLPLVEQYKNRWYATWGKMGNTKVCYATTGIQNADGKRERLYMHNLIMNPQPGQEVDHVHGVRLDNRKSELRLCSYFESQYRIRSRANSTSGYRGVVWNTQVKKWQAHITVDGKRKYVGGYHSAGRAHEECCKALTDLHGEFAGVA